VADETTQADVYELRGSQTELTYRRSTGELTLRQGSEDPRTFDTEATVNPEIGILVTAVLIPITRAGLRVTLTLVLPEVNLEAGSKGSVEVNGAAITTSLLGGAVGRSREVLQQYEVDPLQGTASAG
jgi:hypothetical protein